MHLADYQAKARTLTPPSAGPEQLVAALVGDAGDLARLLGNSSQGSPGWTKLHIRDILGEILFDLNALADAHGLQLAEIAAANLTARHRRSTPSAAGDFFDSSYPDHERLPRHITYTFSNEQRPNGTWQTRIHRDGNPVGDPLTDSSANPDGYRLHDAFHLSYATILGWSPVTRSLLSCKRRSNPTTDENEDGGRAIVIEEAISALIFSYATAHDYFRGHDHIDPALLDRLTALVGHLEVGARHPADWQHAILTGYTIWNQLRDHNGHGIVHADLLARTMTFQSVPIQATHVSQMPLTG
jgi:hypothetical protein